MLYIVDNEGAMTAKTEILTARASKADRLSVERYRKVLAVQTNRKSVSLGEAMLALVHAGIQAVKSAPEVSMTDVLKVLDPSWNGEKPRAGKAIKLSLGRGQSASSLLVEDEG